MVAWTRKKIESKTDETGLTHRAQKKKGGGVKVKLSFRAEVMVFNIKSDNMWARMATFTNTQLQL